VSQCRVLQYKVYRFRVSRTTNIAYVFRPRRRIIGDNYISWSDWKTALSSVITSCCCRNTWKKSKLSHFPTRKVGGTGNSNQMGTPYGTKFRYNSSITFQNLIRLQPHKYMQLEAGKQRLYCVHRIIFCQ
jgi:hypothetical protein